MNAESIHEKTIRELASYLRGYGDAKDNRKMTSAALWLEELVSFRVCCHGIIGCRAGNDCTSDHK